MTGLPVLPADAGESGRRAAEAAARASYGRLVALLAWRWRDVAAAEDALGDAFAAALREWPRSGVPASPEAWLMTAAKRQLLMAARHVRTANDPAVLAVLAFDEADTAPPDVPDERLRMMFVCAHPALPSAVRAPLTLQVVLGLDARAIADAFLVSPSAMAQRLVRAKARIRDAGLRFEEPEARELGERLDAVLEAIYGAFTIGLQRRGAVETATLSPTPDGLAAEAVFLCRVVVALRPTEPEALGLLALMLFCEARRPAQFDSDGNFVPLAAQDTRRWSHALLDEAEACLWRASRCGAIGPFQLEAAIQSAHCEQACRRRPMWPAIATLYAALVAHRPSIGARVGHAVAVAEAGDVPDGLARLDALPEAVVAAYQPYWVARAHLLRKAGRDDDATAATARAIGLTEDVRLRRFLAAPAPSSSRVG